MHIINDIFQIEKSQIILSEHFSNNKRKWEEVNIPSEQAFIKDGYYVMKNTSESNWNYYKTKTQLKRDDDFVIETKISIENAEDAFGHFGLIWGFDKEHKCLNRFTISADGKRILIMQFEKDHHFIAHRFHKRLQKKIDVSKPVLFSLIKLGDYFYFFINKQKVYVGHDSLFCAKGNFAGYYIEPLLEMKSDFFQVKKLKIRMPDVITGMKQLMG